jgi:hypothetical protein
MNFPHNLLLKNVTKSLVVHTNKTGFHARGAKPAKIEFQRCRADDMAWQLCPAT